MGCNFNQVRRFIPTPVGNSGVLFPLILLNSVHPHACGELLFPGLVNFLSYGSSPRLWGTPEHIRNGFCRRRFIPTPVGNSLSIFFLFHTQPVHPHACGELRGIKVCDEWNTGSSPRLWGTLPAGSVILLLNRFIPTPVGNSAAASKK